MELERLLTALSSVRTMDVSVRDWSVILSRSRGMTLGVKDREVGNAHAPLTLHERCEAHYRLIWSDGRVSRGSLERRQLQGDPTEALQCSRAAAIDDPDAAWVLEPSAVPDVEMHDPQTAALACGNTDCLNGRLDSIRNAVDRESLSTWSGSFSAAEGSSRVLNSAGLDVTSAGTTSSWYVVVDGEAGSGFSARHLDRDVDFEARLAGLLDTARQLQRPGPSIAPGLTSVIVAPRVVESYVLGTLLRNLDGAAVANGEGHYAREQFGADRAVMREDLVLRLDPLQPLRRGSYRCTSEGVPAARCTFIDRGRLVQPLLSLKYARRLGLAPTPLPMALDTVLLEGPERLTLPEALDEAADGVVVLSVLGVHTQDGVSGDFSLSAPQGLAVTNGTLGGRTRGTISGNLFDALSSDDLRLVTFEGEHTPGLLLTCRFDPQ